MKLHDDLLSWVTEKMADKGVSQQQLAKRAGVAQGNLSRILHKRRYVETFATLQRLFDVLDDGMRFCRHGEPIPGQCTHCRSHLGMTQRELIDGALVGNQ